MSFPIRTSAPFLQCCNPRPLTCTVGTRKSEHCKIHYVWNMKKTFKVVQKVKQNGKDKRKWNRSRNKNERKFFFPKDLLPAFMDKCREEIYKSCGSTSCSSSNSAQSNLNSKPPSFFFFEAILVMGLKHSLEMVLHGCILANIRFL